MAGKAIDDWVERFVAALRERGNPWVLETPSSLPGFIRRT